MKNLIKILRANSCSCSLVTNSLFSLFLVVLMPLLMVNASAQVFFREYAPATAGASNLGRCIVRPLAGTEKFLHVGQYSETTPAHTAHAIWTNDDGTLNAATNYDRTANEDNLSYSLNFAEDHMVNGSYNMVFPFNPMYSGHPATGYKVFEIGDPTQLLPATWTTIIDPVTHNNVWDHIITNQNFDISVGKSVIRDQSSTNRFFVLSDLSGMNNNGNPQRFAVTRYDWVGGNAGHQMTWSIEYNLDDYRLYPVGIVQDNYDHLVVVGNAVLTQGGKMRIFTCRIHHTLGTILSFTIYNVAVPTPMGPLPWDGDVIANSVTGGAPYTNNYLLIAGKATLSGGNISYPMIFSLSSTLVSNQMAIFKYKNPNCSGDYLNGEFNCAKEYPVGGSTPTVTAVGSIGELDHPGKKDAFILNTSDMTTGTGATVPNWARTHGVYFDTADSAVTTAEWFVAAPDPLTGGDRLVYTGWQSTLPANGIHAVSGSVLLAGGTNTECYAVPCSSSVLNPIITTITKTPDTTKWGEDVEELTYPYSPELDPKYCHDGDVIDFGKSAGEDGEPMIGMNKYGENAIFTVLENSINITYTSSEDAMITLVLVDILGNTLATMKAKSTLGTHYYTISTKDLVTGSYLVAVVSPKSRFNKNIVIIK
ncbi:MAG: hypothetical protein JST20_13715 [Bacteroidetes bacterium]|nr:hypothetical protein [Bacteroidota bacterium]